MQTNMSGYNKIEASPFWMKVLRITGFLCLATLMLPTAYYVKYAALDYPAELKIARSASPAADPLAEPARVSQVQRYIHMATSAPSPALRGDAVRALGAMIALPGAQILHPIECLNAKMTLSQVARQDSSPGVKRIAAETVDRIIARGVVLQR